MFSETAWSGAGSGCSAYETKPTWQHDPGCSRRTVADVSAVADPATGVVVYDSYGITPGWYAFGGTSVASPIVASISALAGGPWANPPASYLYAQPGSLHDVVSGNNGSCGGSYLCTAIAGYDGPTGLGTPNTTAALATTPPAPDFSVSASPTTVNLTPGGANGSSTIALTAQGGLTGMVDLSVDPASDLNPTLSPSSVDLSWPSPQATLSIPAGSTGTHTVTVKAVSQADTTLVHTATITVLIGASTTSQTITFGSLSSRTMLQSPFTVSATASSGLAVTFSTTTPSVCTSSGTNGRTITLVAVRDLHGAGRPGG